MIHPLPKQLNGRLRPVGLQRRHVEVIDEEHRVLSQRGSEYSLAAFVEFSVDQILKKLAQNMVKNQALQNCCKLWLKSRLL